MSQDILLIIYFHPGMLREGNATLQQSRLPGRRDNTWSHRSPASHWVRSCLLYS